MKHTAHFINVGGKVELTPQDVLICTKTSHLSLIKVEDILAFREGLWRIIDQTGSIVPHIGSFGTVSTWYKVEWVLARDYWITEIKLEDLL